MNELLQWNFKNLSPLVQFGVLERGEQSGSTFGELFVPKEWVAMLLGPLLELLWRTYDELMCSNSPHQSVSQCLVSLRMLLTSIARLTGPLLQDSEARHQAVSRILSFLHPRISMTFSRFSNLIAGNDESLSPSARELTAEIPELCLMSQQLIHTHSLEVVCLLGSAFESFFDELVRGSALLANATSESGKVYINGLRRSPVSLVVGSEHLQGWCGDAIRALMLTVSLLPNDTHLFESLQQFASRNSVSLGSIFPALTSMILTSELYLFLEDLEKDEDEISESLDAAGQQELIMCICAIGRMQPLPCLQYLGNCLTQIQSQFEAIQSNSERQLMLLLESARVHIVMISHFCCENFCSSLEAKTGEDSSIPSLLLKLGLQNNAAEFTCALTTMFAVVTRFAHNRLSSPLLIQTSLDFVAEYLLLFAWPDASLYDSSCRMLCSILKEAHGTP